MGTAGLAFGVCWGVYCLTKIILKGKSWSIWCKRSLFITRLIEKLYVSEFVKREDQSQLNKEVVNQVRLTWLLVHSQGGVEGEL